MSGPPVLYHCPCSQLHAPPPSLPSAANQSHPLETLYFCPECDAIRCARCVSVEVSTYYCPNCLFEVPSASVRAEKNRCARNCFVCPACSNTLQTVSMDPSSSTPSDPGEKYILYCTYCRWDSTLVAMTFDKPQGLASQFQKIEDDSPSMRELERLRDHFEPLLRPRTSLHPYTHARSSSANNAALATLRRDGRDTHGHGMRASRLGRSGRARDVEREKEKYEDDLPSYKSITAPDEPSEQEDISLLRSLTEVDDILPLSQQQTDSWIPPLYMTDQRPLRLPLQSKKSKRCPACRHILIRPEQKAQSTKFKVKIVAANYLPALEVSRPEDASVSHVRRRTGTVGSSGEMELHAGRSYHFVLALTNPLYDPINLRLGLQQPSGEGTSKPHFAVHLPTNTIGVAAFTDVWDYDEDEAGEEDVPRAGQKDLPGRWKLGVVERKANTTKVGGELVLSREAQGDVKVNLLVTYTYKSEDSQAADGKEKGEAELKTFAFWTVVWLGTVPLRQPESTSQPVS
ncbi:dynactin p62 [Dacryopinax primogenitus]|uniref:Dynactin subunit 4 n=1 Tax=Dacryopinax primogenitus (strain DJM 731) TaxID=1858805 RepID=M5FWX5_DACPD|nr:dynactin p62 [Dacryopinax primogenitus]EJU00180.1 dynactin p62 [Dacryopinax primogenitus]